MLHVGSNLTVPNFYCREIDSTILTCKLSALNSGVDHAVVFIFGCAVLDKFNRTPPW